MDKPLNVQQTILPDPIEGVMLRSIELIRNKVMELDIALDIHEADQLAELAIVTALGLGWRPPVN